MVPVLLNLGIRAACSSSCHRPWSFQGGERGTGRAGQQVTCPRLVKPQRLDSSRPHVTHPSGPPVFCPWMTYQYVTGANRGIWWGGVLDHCPGQQTWTKNCGHRCCDPMGSSLLGGQSPVWAFLLQAGEPLCLMKTLAVLPSAKVWP